MKKYLLLIVIITISYVGVFAQNGSIEGVIKQTDSTHYLSGVSIFLKDTKLGTITNGSGKFYLNNIPQGDYELVASAIGYFTVKRSIKIKEGSILKINFSMQESVSDLSEIVIITGGSLGAKKIAGSAYYISPKEIEQFSYTDINRTLRMVPGVNIQEEDGFGLFPNIGLRGSGSERSSKITVMEDGVLSAPAPYAAPSAYYFPTVGRMQGVEILKGSSQIKYGPYTTGGAINLISTQIPKEFSGKLSLTAGSFNTKNLHAYVGNSHDNFAYLVETFQFNSNGFKEIDQAGNRGFTVNSGFDKKDYLAKFRINTDKDAKIYQSLSFKMGNATADINETYLGLTQEDFDDNPIRRYVGSQMDNIKTDQSQFSLTHYAKLSDLFDITTVAYRTNFKRNWYKLDRVKGSDGNKIKIAELLDNPEIYPEAYNIVTGTSSINDDALFVKANNRSYYGKGVQTVLGFNYDTYNMSHKIDFGFRIHQDQIDRFQWYDEYAMDDNVMQLTNAGIHGTESNRVETANAVATYIQYRLNIGKFTTTPGIRYESITNKRKDYGENDPDRTGVDLSIRSNTVNVFMPGIGFDYKFNNNISSFAGIHKGFAPPGSKEELEPEESINYELGIRYSKKGLSGQAIFFLNDYTNLLGIDLEASGGEGTNEQFNGGAVKTKGIEFNLTYDLLFSKEESKYSLPFSIVYTYTDARFQNDFDSDFDGWGTVESGDAFPYLANNQFTLILGLEHQKFSVNLSGKYQGDMRTNPGQGTIPSDEIINSNFIIDASANYILNKNISLFTTATNLTDEIYLVARRPAGLRPGMPRAFNFGLKVNF
ncbi:MAG: TonB-dependent receptor [Flavobacteriaceae bacterium]|nr:TonB-dependent receptor [Flavobacteriaceae bacterium]